MARPYFVLPLLVGLNARNADMGRVYSAENDIFLRTEEAYRDQLAALQRQWPRIEAEIKAVTEQIASQNERLDIVNGRIADLEPLFSKGLLRKEILSTVGRGVGTGIALRAVDDAALLVDDDDAKRHRLSEPVDIDIGDRATYGAAATLTSRLSRYRVSVSSP